MSFHRTVGLDRNFPVAGVADTDAEVVALEFAAAAVEGDAGRGAVAEDLLAVPDTQGGDDGCAVEVAEDKHIPHLQVSVLAAVVGGVAAEGTRNAVVDAVVVAVAVVAPLHPESCFRFVKFAAVPHPNHSETQTVAAAVAGQPLLSPWLHVAAEVVRSNG